MDAVYDRLRSLLDAGCMLPGSSDRPVVNDAPLLGPNDRVRRRTSGGHLLGPAERITAGEGLRADTHGSAFAAFRERDFGTVVGGELVYQRGMDAHP